MTTHTGNTLLHTRTGAHSLAIRLADSFLGRFTGLMLSKPLAPDAGLLITACPSVHTAFMRYAIDIIYLDRAGKVLKCVPRLRPWRGSISNFGKDAQGKREVRAAHVLELAAGSIDRLAIHAGDHLEHAHWQGVEDHEEPERPQQKGRQHRRQRGSAMVEFVVVGPIITLLGMAILQYGMLFFAKNQINHAAFMAARAGSMGNANLNLAKDAYIRALIPLYGGGTNTAELARAACRARDAVEGTQICLTGVSPGTRIELLSPTQESYADWNDPALQAALNTGSKRVIPNGNQAFKDQHIGATSGQSIQDANMIKLRITHGYEPTVPLMRLIYSKYLKWADTKTDAFHTQVVNAGGVPVVTNVTLQMQSDAIEGDPISSPGTGNNGNPSDPGDPPVVTTPPPNCASIGCTVISIPIINPPPPTDCTGDKCTVCT